jgi:hypothetical protein
MESTLKNIYKPVDDFVFSYVVPTFFITAFIITILIQYLKVQLIESKQEWETNMCVPKYMFVSGFLHKEPGEHFITATFDNFKRCVDKFKPKNSTTINRDNLNNRFKRLLLAVDASILNKHFESTIDLTITKLSEDQLTLQISNFLNITGMTQKEFDNSTDKEIKNIIESAGRQHFWGTVNLYNYVEYNLT